MKSNIMKIIVVIFTSIIMINLQIAFAEAGIQINSHARKGVSFLSETMVHFIVTDPMGRKLGYDPLNDKYYNEFPEGIASYGTGGMDESFSIEALFDPIDGNYTIEIIGDRLIEFSLDISIYRGIKGEGFTDFEFKGLADKNLTSKFQMTYSSDPKFTPKAEKIVTISDAKNDVNTAYDLGLITNAGIEQSLIAKLNAAEKAITKGQKQTAENQLNAFINEVNAQKDKHIKDSAVKILIEDAEYLINHL